MPLLADGTEGVNLSKSFGTGSVCGLVAVGEYFFTKVTDMIVGVKRNFRKTSLWIDAFD